MRIPVRRGRTNQAIGDPDDQYAKRRQIFEVAVHNLRMTGMTIVSTERSGAGAADRDRANGEDRDV